MGFIICSFPGSCDDLRLKLKVRGGNPGRLTSKWYASLAEGEDKLSPHMTTMLDNLNTFLKKHALDSQEVVLKANQTMFLGKSSSLPYHILIYDR